MEKKVHWKILRGENVAMYAVKYTDGTQCEVLAGVQREITVFYGRHSFLFKILFAGKIFTLDAKKKLACDENGNDNIAAFEEISSCIYEMVVVTKHICSHPSYKLI